LRPRPTCAAARVFGRLKRVGHRLVPGALSPGLQNEHSYACEI
jgi:hypothetical protein